jgi:Family with sequence similarity 184, A and B
MSKKIAQLTKVVYYLNTKNEDHVTELTDVNYNHEDEMQELLLASEQNINSYKAEVAEALNKLHAQELVIHSYTEKMRAKDEQIHTLQENQKLLQVAQKESHARPRSHDTPESPEAMHKREVEEMRDDFQRQLFNLQTSCAEKLDDQQTKFEKEVYLSDVSSKA